MAELGLLNTGMLDQRLALHWIQESIAAFGESPSKVTLFGDSTGAVSMYSHMMAYGGRDDRLFQQTLNALLTNSAPKGFNTTEQLSESLAKNNRTLPKQSPRIFPPQPLPNTTVSKLPGLYPTAPRLGCPYNTGDTRLTPGGLDKKACSIFGDLVIVAPAQQHAATLAAGGVSVYCYRFKLPPASAAPARGVSTGVEQANVFSNLDLGASAWDRALAYEMASTWVSFAHGLDPNPGSHSTLPHWPEYGKEANIIVFNGHQGTYREEGIEYITQNVLPDGVL
ncbi:hypothetical protein PG999_012234 [Apiospora kogelbergensis]|uniref:Carboxylesterase type B domain-containing protein n=1 Tax=Apiospora kogelbergensis TaxID=1337665 RepID=A0AAW0QFE1_9PEZI